MTQRPSPVPKFPLVLKNGSKIKALSSGLIPGPVIGKRYTHALAARHSLETGMAQLELGDAPLPLRRRWRSARLG